MCIRDSNSTEHAFQLERPTWYDFYDLIQSSYCFGSFEPLNLSSDGETAVFYLDSAIRESAELSDLSAVISFYNYYVDVFGSNLEKPVVLLPVSYTHLLISNNCFPKCKISVISISRPFGALCKFPPLCFLIETSD